MTTIRRKKTTPLEDFADMPEKSPLLKKVCEELKGSHEEYAAFAEELKEPEDLNLTKLDLFALFASSAVAKKIDDVSQIAHTSYQIAFKMAELSEIYKDWSPVDKKTGKP